jgi:hypothetical protein
VHSVWQFANIALIALLLERVLQRTSAAARYCDIAVALLGNKVEYGRSLLASEQTRGAASALAMSAGGGSLLARVRRLFGFAPSQAFSGGSVALVGLLAAATIAIGVWAALAQEPDQGKKEGVVVKVPGSGTLDVALSPDGKILARAGSTDDGRIPSICRRRCASRGFDQAQKVCLRWTHLKAISSHGRTTESM